MASRIESTNKIEVIEENGIDLNSLRSQKTFMTINEHWNKRDYVIVNMGDLSYTVRAIDLEKAIQNAQNAHSGF